jgi:ADP-ribose pyrophosphatase YjhB (NUDIX family)
MITRPWRAGDCRARGFFLQRRSLPVTEERTDRTYPTRPMVGVGAVVLKGRQVLLAKRGKPPAQGTWSLPGGLLELGETAEQGVAREVQEETGILVEVGPIIGLFQPIQRDDDDRVRYHFVVIDILAYYRAGDPVAGDDAADLRWVDPQDLPLYNVADATRDMIERGLALAEAAG